jgi:hypothetical protein
MEDLKKVCANNIAILAIEKYIKNIPRQKNNEIKESTKVKNENTEFLNSKSKNSSLIDLEMSSEEDCSSNEEQSDKILFKKSKIEIPSKDSDNQQNPSLSEFKKRMNIFLNLWTNISHGNQKKIYDEMKNAIIDLI